MGCVVNLDQVRRIVRPPGAARGDPAQAEVFPGVTLADLWRIWAQAEKRRDAGSAELACFPRLSTPLEITRPSAP